MAGRNRRKAKKPSAGAVRLELSKGLAKIRAQLKVSLSGIPGKSSLAKLSTGQERLRREVRKLQAEFNLYLSRQSLRKASTGGLEAEFKVLENEKRLLLKRIQELETSRLEKTETLAVLKRGSSSHETALEAHVRDLERRLQASEDNYLKEKQILEYKIKTAQAEAEKFRLELSVRTMFDKREEGKK